MNIDRKNIGILGLGISGYWAAKLAKSMGANVFISDSKFDINKKYAKELIDLGIDVELGSHSKKILNSDLVINHLEYRAIFILFRIYLQVTLK